MTKDKKERRTYILLLLTMCLISFGLGYWFYSKTYHKEIRHVPINDSITLNVSPIVPKDVLIKNSYVGHTIAINQVSIVPYISGYLQNIIVKEGANVNKGDLLITVEPSEYKAKLEGAKAELMKTKASYEYNKNYYERIKKSGEKTFSDIERDNAKNNFLQSEALLQNATANKLLAEINYNYTIIKSPINGVVGNFDLTEGNFVSPEKGELLNIVQLDPIRVVFSITDKEYINLFKYTDSPFKDSVIKITLPNGDIFEHSGEYKYTDSTINKNTNSLAIYVDFKNDKKTLLPNAFVTVDIYKEIKNSINIKKNRVIMNEKGNFVTIIRDNQILKMPIKIITENNNNYIVKNTFNSGDLLLLDNLSNNINLSNAKLNIIQ
jgi:membrane fusion protein (multidrug efflux system)